MRCLCAGCGEWVWSLNEFELRFSKPKVVEPSRKQILHYVAIKKKVSKPEWVRLLILHGASARTSRTAVEMRKELFKEFDSMGSHFQRKREGKKRNHWDRKEIQICMSPGFGYYLRFPHWEENEWCLTAPFQDIWLLEAKKEDGTLLHSMHSESYFNHN